MALSNVGLSGVESESDSLNRVMRVPVAATFFAGLSLALGWAFLMTGASDCRRRVFLPIALLFANQWIIFTSAWGPLVPLIGLGHTPDVRRDGLHFFTRHRGYRQEIPLIEFSAWLVFMLVAMASHEANLVRESCRGRKSPIVPGRYGDPRFRLEPRRRDAAMPPG